MKTIVYNTKDKSKFGGGPWQHEPDKVQYEDQDTGLPCLMVRTDMGVLCGYVGVPESHPFFGKRYEDIDVDVHGGLTFSALCHPDAPEDSGICHIPGPGESDKVWWFGFDCAHYGDLIPSMKAILPEFRITRNEAYKDFDFVKYQIKYLAVQLKAVV